MRRLLQSESIAKTIVESVLFNRDFSPIAKTGGMPGDRVADEHHLREIEASSKTTAGTDTLI